MRILFNLHVPKMRIFSLEPVLLIRNLDPVGSWSSEIRIWIRSDQSISNSESGSGWIGVAKYESGSGRIRVYRIQNLDPVGLDFQIQNPGPDLLNKILIGFFTRTYHATCLFF